MGYAERTRTCHKCGQEMTGRLPPVAEVTCIHCRIGVMMDHNRQMHIKRGPAYQRWRAGMARWAKSLEDAN